MEGCSKFSKNTGLCKKSCTVTHKNKEIIFSQKLCENLLKLREILFKISYDSLKNFVRFSWKLREIFLKTEKKFLDNWVKF